MGRRKEIFVSPDGGETVYVQKKDGSRGRMVKQSQYAKDVIREMEEAEMVGREAIRLRRKYPALGKAWDQYKTIWGMIRNEE